MCQDRPLTRQPNRLKADPLAVLANFFGVEAGQAKIAQSFD